MIRLLATLTVLLIGPAAAQVSRISLESPGAHDGANSCVLSSDGTTAFVCHGDSGSITAIDVASGQVVDDLRLGGELARLSSGDQRARLLAFDRLAGEVHVIQPQPLTLLHTVNVAVAGPSEVQIDETAGVAVLLSETLVSVVDLVAGVELQSFPIPALPPFGGLSFVERLVVEPGAATAIVLSPGFQGALLERYDLATGAAIQSLSLGGGQVGGLAERADRTQFVTFAVQPVFPGQGGITLTLFDAATLTEISVTTLTSTLPFERVVALSSDSRRALIQQVAARGESVVELFPGPGSGAPPSVTSFAGTSGLIPATDPALTWSVTSTTSFGSVRVRDFVLGTETFVRVGRGALVYLTRASVAPAADRVGLVAGAGADRALVVDLAGGTPTIAGEFNTGGDGEFDGPAGLVVNSTGNFAVVFGTTSDVATIVDLRTRSVRGTVDLEARPLSAVALTNGRFAVGLESGRIILIDPATMVSGPVGDLNRPVIELITGPGPGQILARTAAGAVDLLDIVDLTTGTVPSSFLLPASNLGYASALPMEPRTLSFDAATGRIYAISVGAAATLERIDVVTGTCTSLTLPGLFFARPGLLFDEARGRVFISTGTENLAAIDVSGAVMSVLWTRTGAAFGPPAGGSPRLHLSDDGAVLFADLSRPFDPGFGVPQGPGLAAVDAATGALLGNVPETYALDLAVHRDLALVTRGSEIVLQRHDRGTSTFVDTESILPGGAAPLAAAAELDPSRGRALVTDAGKDAALLILDLFHGRTTLACDGGPPNSTGVRASLALSGSPFAGDVLVATASGLAPNGMFGLLAVGDALTAPMPLAGSQGDLCLGGALGRFVNQVQPADGAGQQRFLIDSSRLPIGAGGVAATAGSTFAFQGWHRDVTSAGAPTSNTTTALALQFR